MVNVHDTSSLIKDTTYAIIQIHLYWSFKYMSLRTQFEIKGYTKLYGIYHLGLIEG